MDILSALFRGQTRHIGFIVPQVVISEKHTDAIEIALHPVQIGANISDHAWVKPSEITIVCGFAGGGSLVDFADSSALGITMGLSPAEVYQQLLALQKMCEPFEVVTSKRTYSNMLMRQIDITTDHTNEHILTCTLTLVQVLFCATEDIPAADKSEMKQGVSTSSVQNGGTKTTMPVGNITVTPLPEPTAE